MPFDHGSLLWRLLQLWYDTDENLIMTTGLTFTYKF